jgi:acyl-CoA thioesterase
MGTQEKAPENDAIRYARDVVGGDPMARHLGIEVLEVAENFARVALNVRPEYLNALDRAHGITVYALADQALAVAANSGGGSAMVLESKINFLNGVPAGARLVAEARPVERKRTIGLWNVEVRQEGTGVLVATCQGLTYHKTG